MTRIALHFEPGTDDGFTLITDDPAAIAFSIDERYREDRVYRFTEGLTFRIVTAAEFDALLGTSPIGVLGDKPIAEQAARAMMSRQDGQPSLTLVKKP